MKLKPGSFLWLVGHDLLLSWRGFRALFGGLRPLNVAIVITGTLIAFHALALPLAQWFRNHRKSRRWRRAILFDLARGDDIRAALAAGAIPDQCHAGALFARRHRYAAGLADIGKGDTRCARNRNRDRNR